MYTLVNEVSNNPTNCNVGYNNSWLRVDNDADRDLYAQASYVTNFDDFTLTLSARDVNIGAVEIKDGNSNLKADVTSANGYNALRVLSQDLESSADDVTIGDRSGNYASVYAPTSSLNVKVTNTITSITTPEPMHLDAFGRLRVSQPVTLFDSSHRYKDNNLWASLTSVGGVYSFNQNQGLIDLTVNSLSGSSVIRETTKVFSYQPGKSLLILNTFVFSPSSTNLRQRVGYFGQDNGIYLQLDNGVLSFVERTLVNGSPSSESIIPVSGWNIDKLNGTGPSGFTLDITKAQIFWIDIEWLGVGTVRCGFVIDGKIVHCHSFHHSNRISSTYITTASLPLRYEITNKNNTGVIRTMKQICSTVISEGGYSLTGLQQAIGVPIDAAKNLANKGIFYPIVTIKLKQDNKDAIVILTAISLLAKSIGYYNWKLIASGITSGGSGTWISAGDNSAVQYKLDATSITGGRTLASGYFTTSNQGSTQVDLLKETLFKFQLERDTLNNNNYELTLAVSSDTDNRDIYGSADWEEVSR
jgi:hypothetical protein